MITPEYQCTRKMLKITEINKIKRLLQPKIAATIKIKVIIILTIAITTINKNIIITTIIITIRVRIPQIIIITIIITLKIIVILIKNIIILITIIIKKKIGLLVPVNIIITINNKGNNNIKITGIIIKKKMIRVIFNHNNKSIGNNKSIIQINSKIFREMNREINMICLQKRF